MTSLPVSRPYSDEELRALYPSSLQLISAQVVFRHGERTPVKARLQEAGIPEIWALCEAASHLRLPCLASKTSNDPKRDWSEFKFTRKLELSEAPGKAALFKSPTRGEAGACSSGELTDKGRQSTLALGERLRHLYIRQLGFLDDTIENANQIYMRHTPIKRTADSLIQVFSGLYPQEKRGPNFETVILTREPIQENLYRNEARCKKLSVLARQFTKMAADKWNAEVDQVAGPAFHKYIHGPVAIDGHPSVSGLLDTVNSCIGNDVKMPKEFSDPAVLSILERAAVDEWFRGYAENEDYRRLGCGQLIGEIQSRLDAAASAKSASPRKICLYSAHDTTLGGLLTSLGSFDGRWPPYTSSLAFELFRSPSQSWISADRHYVRLRYNEKPVQVPECAGHGYNGDSSFCDLKQFRAIAERLTPKSLEQECKV